MVKFIANDRGLYFPANGLVVLSFRPNLQEEWLHVPWEGVRDIRLAREVGEDGPCVAFDLEVTAGEANAFFKFVGTPRDRSRGLSGILAVAYGDSPPRPTRTVAILLRLKARSDGQSSTPTDVEV